MAQSMIKGSELIQLVGWWTRPCDAICSTRIFAGLAFVNQSNASISEPEWRLWRQARLVAKGSRPEEPDRLYTAAPIAQFASIGSDNQSERCGCDERWRENVPRGL